jgi:esterase/lipase superfamily enzyme
VKIFYATDRRPTGSGDVARFYGSERADEGTMNLGTAEVSIPKDHKMGELESPSMWRLEFRKDPAKHIVLLRVQPEKDAASFFGDLANSVENSADKRAFVFIHGYNVTFEDAARRTAQMAYDLGFDGAPILYSWPSQGTLVGYPADEATVDWTAKHLKDFLEDVVARTHARTVHLIAHSMGNRALVAALNSMAGQGSPALPTFKQVILAAPDIDAGLFKQMAANFPPMADRVTVYASSKDRALIVSRKYHQYLRVGDPKPSVTIVPRVDTIDASAVDTGLVGHSYYGDNRSILTDIFYLMKDGNPPGKRFGMHGLPAADSPTYWAFRP